MAQTYPTISLQPGQTGESVKKLQQYLVSQGYMTQAQMDTGPGIYGPRTKAAITALQQKLGVDVAGYPGYWGPRTLTALQGVAPVPKPGEPGFIGPVQPPVPKPGEPGFIGPVQPETEWTNLFQEYKTKAEREGWNWMWISLDNVKRYYRKENGKWVQKSSEAEAKKYYTITPTNWKDRPEGEAVGQNLTSTLMGKVSDSQLDSMIDDIFASNTLAEAQSKAQSYIKKYQSATVQQQITTTKTQITDLQAQQAALTRYGLTDTNQLIKDASGNYVPIPTVDPNEQARIDAANAANEAAQTIFDNIPEGDDVDMRDSTKILEDIQEKLEEAAEKVPAPVSMVDLFKEQKEKLGIDVLETDLANLDADIERIQTELLVQAEEAGEKLISTREIGRAKGVLQKRAEREIALINVERSAVARIMGNKIDTLNAIIRLTDMDYDNASDYYTKEYNRQIQLYNLVSGAEERELTHAERATDDARANLILLQNLLKDGNLTYDTLTADQKLKITTLEIQSGWPSGLTAGIMTDEPDKKIQTVVSRTDSAGNTYFDVLLVDSDGTLTVKSIFKGRAAPSVTVENKYWTEIDQGRADLRKGETWGNVWNRIKNQFPDKASEIERDLGLEVPGVKDMTWKQAGAYEAYKAKGEKKEFGTAAEQSKAMQWLSKQPGVTDDDYNRLKTDRDFFYWALSQSEEL